MHTFLWTVNKRKKKRNLKYQKKKHILIMRSFAYDNGKQRKEMKNNETLFNDVC